MANEARITDESIISTLSPDDYILVDNATLGTRKVSVKTLLGKQDPPSIVLCHFDENFVNNQFTDDKGNVWTRSNFNAYVTNSYHKFGLKSIYWNSSASTYVYTGLMPELNFLTGDFTIDFWLYFNGGSGRRTAFTLGTATSSGLQIDFSNLTPRMWFIHPTQNKWLIGGDTYYYSGISSINLTNYKWHHIAMVRNGGVVTLYIDGRVGRSVNIGNTTLRNFNDGPGCQIGTWGYTKTSYVLHDAAIDEFRIIGQAMWTSSFTPPNRPYDN